MQFDAPQWKQFVRKSVATLFTSIWQIGFHVVGHMRPCSARTWASEGNQRVWVIAPHPDDETVGCAGTILRHRAVGDQVHLLVVTDGSGSRAFGLNAVEMAERRQKELWAVAQLLGVQEQYWLGLPENRWEPDQLIQQLAAMWRNHPAPDIIYAPSFIDFHPEHLRVAHALAATLTDCPSPIVRVYPIHVPLTAVLTNLICDVSRLLPQIEAAIDAYTTQYYSTRVALRQRRYAAAQFRVGSLVESFWEMTASQYVTLHGTLPPRSVHAPYRGLRVLPVSDPLAYWYGRQCRRQLTAAIEGKPAT